MFGIKETTTELPCLRYVSFGGNVYSAEDSATALKVSQQLNAIPLLQKFSHILEPVKTEEGEWKSYVSYYGATGVMVSEEEYQALKRTKVKNLEVKSCHPLRSGSFPFAKLAISLFCVWNVLFMFKFLEGAV